MEEKSISATTLRQRMRLRGVSQNTLAVAAGMQQSTLSGILNGWIRLRPEREARIAAAIVRLRLDRDEETPEPIPPAAPVTIRIRPL